MRVQIVLFDGFDPMDVVGPYEVFWAGGLASGGAVTVELVSAEGGREVTSGSGALCLRAATVLEPGRADVVVVPGAAGPVTAAHDDADTATVPVLLGRTLDTRLPALLRRALDDPKVTVAAVCGGALVLAMANLIGGRHAVTHHLGMDLLDATGVVATSARIVDDGDLVTAGGVTSGLDLGLYLLEREIGPRVALAVEQLFAYERRGTVWHRRGAEALPF